MDLLVASAKHFRTQREAYNTEYKAVKASQSQKEYEKTKQLQQNYYESGVMSREMLHQLGEMIIHEYEYEKEKADTSILDGIPGFLCPSAQPHFFEEYKSTLYVNNCDCYDDTSDEDDKQKTKEERGNTPGERCQWVYLKCLDTIFEHGISIYGVKKDLSQYKDRGQSCLCGGSRPFIFYCRKNNFEFHVNFDDDCDCDPGILYVNEVTEMDSGKKISTRCDLFCQNTSRIVLENFLQLINSNNWEAYKEKRYGHLMALPALLRSKGFKVTESVRVTSENLHTAVNYNDIDFFFEVSNSEGTCLVFPYEKKPNTNYVLYVSPTLEDINKREEIESVFKTSYKRETLSGTTTVEKYSFDVSYQREEDIDELVRCVGSYLQWKKGNYGYLEQGVFYNDKTVREKLKDIGMSSNIYSVSNNFVGPDFDVFVAYSPSSRNYEPLYRNRLDMPYIYDYYGLHFWYDKKVNPDQCYLTIQRCHCDLTRVATKYYENESFYKKTNAWKNFTYKDYMERSDIVKYDGTFTQCLSKLVNFIESTK